MAENVQVYCEQGYTWFQLKAGGHPDKALPLTDASLAINGLQQ